MVHKDCLLKSKGPQSVYKSQFIYEYPTGRVVTANSHKVLGLEKERTIHWVISQNFDFLCPSRHPPGRLCCSFANFPIVAFARVAKLLFVCPTFIRWKWLLFVFPTFIRYKSSPEFPFFYLELFYVRGVSCEDSISYWMHFL